MYYMIDNYDSFVYNLSAYFEEAGREVLVRRADQVSLSEIYALHPEGIILSPGPKRPVDAKSFWNSKTVSPSWAYAWDIR